MTQSFEYFPSTLIVAPSTEDVTTPFPDISGAALEASMGCAGATSPERAERVGRTFGASGSAVASFWGAALEESGVEAGASGLGAGCVVAGAAE